jgi:hypothetical protein
MDPISAAAAYSVANSQSNTATEVGIRVIKMANDNQKAVMDLLLKTFQAAATGLGQNIDVQA